MGSHWLIGVFTLVLPALASMPVSGQGPAEYQVKAAYLYGFGRFVEWPAGATTLAGPDFVVCVLGTDPFGRALDDVTTGAVLKMKRVVVRRIASADDSLSCHVLFVSGSEAARLGRILDAVAHRPILTVGDSAAFARRGGMIGFTIDSGRVRFTVNLNAAQQAGLMLQSELLRVAAGVLRE